MTYETDIMSDEQVRQQCQLLSTKYNELYTTYIELHHHYTKLHIQHETLKKNTGKKKPVPPKR